MLPGELKFGAFNDLPVLFSELLGVRSAVVASHLKYLNDGIVRYGRECLKDDFSRIEKVVNLEWVKYDRI